MKRNLLSLVLGIFVFAIQSPAQKYGWAKHFYPPGPVDPSILILNEGKSMAKDAAGNLYTTGTFADTVDFDPGAGTFFLSSRVTTYQNQFVTKLSPDGNLVWAANIGNNATSGTGGGQVFPNAIAVGVDGCTYTTGYFTGTVDFDPGTGAANFTATAAFPGNVFISKLNADGSYAWTKILLGSNSSTAYLDNGYGIAVDDANNVYTVGEYSGTLDVDPGPGVINTIAFSTNSSDGFLVKLNASGDYVAHDTISTTAIDRMTDIVYKNGFLYATTWSRVTAVITKYDLNLNTVWEKHTENLGTGSEWPWSLTVDDAGNTIMVGSFSGLVDFDPGPAQYLLNAASGTEKFLCKWDRNGLFRWVQRYPQVYYGTYVSTDRNGDIYVASSGDKEFNTTKYNFKGDYQWTANMYGVSSYKQDDIVADDDGNIFSTGYFINSADFDPDPNVYNPITIGSGKSAAYVNKISNKNHISGTAFLDANNDGIRQANEDALPYRIVTAVNGSLVFNGITRADGSYDIYTDTGTYSITMPQLPPYYMSALASHTASFATEVGGIDSANHFPVIPILTVNDLSINVLSTQRLRRGSVCYTDLIYTNTGTTTLSGTITLRHDPQLIYQSATPAPNAYSNPTLTWNFTNLRPFESRIIFTNLLVPFNLPNGATATHIATINPVANDSTPLNNVDSTREVVVGSYDPNDKTVFPAGAISKSFICADSSLDYVVRFQNTGTDTAFIVVVADTIQDNLDLKSIQVVGASHPFTVRIDEGRIVKFIFKNIMLPDSNVNEPLSHGFVSYKIRPLSTLAVGDVVKNTAAIYFDFNTAVITNQTSNTVAAVQAPAINITSPNSTTCAGTAINFTATAGYGGNSPTYQWQVNGGNVGTNSPAFSSSTLNNGDQVRCLLTSSNAACLSTPNATSNIITVNISPSVVPAAVINASGNNICSGTSVTFTATPTNGGTTPTYQWQVNGVNAGTNSNTFTTSTLNNNDQVKVTMTSSLGCASPATATSNIITMSVSPAPTAHAGNDTSICSATSAQLQASGGTSYSWTPAAGLSNPNIANPVATPAITTAYIVTVSNGGTCNAKDTVVVTVMAAVTPAVSITASTTSICSGTTVTFTATPVNGGTATYQWQVNGVNAGTNNNTFTSSTLTNNAQVKVTITSSLTCVTASTATSNIITILVTPMPTANAGNDVNICAGGSAQLQAAGGTTYVWSPAAGLSNPNIANPVATPAITTQYVVTVSNSATCFSKDTVIVTVGGSASPTVNISTANNNICSGTAATFVAVPTNGGTSPTYQWQVDGINAGTNSNTFTSAALTNNSQVKVLLTSNSACVTTPNAVSNTIVMQVNQLTVPTISVNSLSFTVTNPDAAATYSWQVKANNVWSTVIPAATGITYTATAAGEYRVKAVKGACTVYSAAALSNLVSPVSHFIYVRPNPAADFVRFDSISLFKRYETLEIMDMQGKRLMPLIDIKRQATVTVDISILSKGMYMAIFRTWQDTFTALKFIKQ